MSLQILAAGPRHAAAIADVHVRAWQRAYAHILPAGYLAGLSVPQRLAQWRETIARGEPEVHVAIDAGDARSGAADRAHAVAGFVCLGASRDAGAPADCGEVWALYVAPEHWSRGVGAALWRAAQARLAARGCRRATLWVMADNDRALRFYRRVGFEVEAASRQPFELGGVRIDELRCVATLAA